ncbi:MAG: hypothetical protein IT186_07050 [Acidobacteria bacterium]|nr:hypothetical protein [Acidobacteriota bacterium]
MIEIRPRDTSEEAWNVYCSVIAAMTPAKRVEMAFEMSEWGRELARTGIRTRHPEYSESQIELALFRLLYGDDLFHQVYPGEDLRI